MMYSVFINILSGCIRIYSITVLELVLKPRIEVSKLYALIK